MRRLVLFLVAALCLLGGGTAYAAPLAPLPGPDSKVTRIEVYTPSSPSKAGESTRFYCTAGKPTATIYFSARGTGKVRVTAQRTTDPNPDPQDVYWSQLVEYGAEGSTMPVDKITGPDNGTPFYVVIIPGPGDKSGPGVVPDVVLTHEACDTKTPPSALQAPGTQPDGYWWNDMSAIPVWAVLALLVWLLLRPRR